MDDGTPSQSVEHYWLPSFPLARAIASAVLGVGKSCSSSLRFDELLWWLYHKPIIDGWRHDEGHPTDPWDLLQVLTVVGTNGAYFPERHKAITQDGYLLVSHKVLIVPNAYRRRFYDRSAFTLSTFCCLYFFRLWHWCVRRLVSRTASTYPMVIKKSQLEAPNDATAAAAAAATVGTTTQFIHEVASSPSKKLDPLLPVESTRASGYTRVFTTPPDEVKERSPESPNEPTPSLGGHIISSTSSMMPCSSPQIVLFQHGLLESSLSWVLPLWSADAAPLDLVDRAISFPWRMLWRLVEYCTERQRQCWRPQPVQPQSYANLKHSLPFHLLDADPRLQIWLTNSRGNEFSLNVGRQRTLVPTPLGYRPLTFKDYSRIFRIYEKEHWTYVDSAVHDCDTIYTMLVSHYQTHKLRISVVSFSQGCAVYSLHAALKTYCKAQQGASYASSSAQLSPEFPIEPCDELNTPMAVLSPAATAEDCVQDETAQVRSLANSSWSSGIFSVEDTEIAIAQHLNGECGGLVKCEICNLMPKSLIMVSPPIMLKSFDDPSNSILEYVRAYFCTAAWDYLHYVVLAVEVMQSLLHVRLGFIGHMFVRYILRFNLFPIHKDIANLAFRLTPSGMTTRRNMELWKRQMLENAPLGWLLPFTPASQDHILRVWKSSKVPTRVELSTYLPCPTHIYSAMYDNIADSVRGADVMVKEGHASLRLIDLSENYVDFTSTTKVSINLLAGGSHLDIIWPSAKLTKLQSLIANDILHTFK